MRDEHDPGTLDVEDAAAPPVGRPIALGSFVFAGGFTAGVARHFDVQAVLEEGPYGVATHRANFPGVPVHVGRGSWPLSTYERHEWDLVYGNPPCAAWSAAGKVTRGGRWQDDPRVDCTRRHFELLRLLRPKFWVWESVCRALTTGREFVDGLAREASEMGYSVTYLLHDAALLGVPQRRQRFFFVAHSAAFSPELPNTGNVYDAEAYDTVRRINDVGDPRPDRLPPALESLFPQMTDKKTLRDVFDELHPEPALNDRGQVTGRPSFGYKLLPSTGPAKTFAGYGVVHPDRTRLLTPREEAALCGFPPGYEFVGSGVSSQIARGVCPPVAGWLAGQIARDLRRDHRADGRVRRVDLRKRPGETQLINLEAAAMMRASLPRVQGTTESVGAASPVNRSDARPADLGPVPIPAGPGSGKYIRELLALGVDPPAIVAAVHRHFPGAKTTARDVAWNRAKMRRDGPAERPAGAPEVPDGLRRQDAVLAAAEGLRRGVRDAAAAILAANPGLARLAGHPSALEATAEERREELERAAAAAFNGPDPVLTAQFTAEADGASPAQVPDAPQPTRRRTREQRRFDQTALTATTHGYRVHRDYAAHFFRWGWVADRWVKDRDVLDVGCGRDVPLVKVLSGRYPGHQPRRYVGVDFNPLPEQPQRSWAEYRERFDFTSRHGELGQFDTVVCLEVIEHMGTADGAALLTGVRSCLRPGGRFLLSTPVFDGRAAANHVHEYTVPELKEVIERCGMEVVRRHGTFASRKDLNRAVPAEQLELLDRLNEFYSTDVTSCFLAPLYPDASRNNAWVIKRRGDQ